MALVGHSYALHLQRMVTCSYLQQLPSHPSERRPNQCCWCNPEASASGCMTVRGRNAGCHGPGLILR